jgi:hypothetical protein
VGPTTDAEVIVAGGGLAGCAAAIAAARGGARTLLVERENALGGEAGGGLVGGCENQFYGPEAERSLGGIPAEIVERIHQAQFGRPLDWRDHAGTYWFCHEPETVKLVLQQMCGEAGVELLLGSTITGVLADGARLTGLVLHAPDRRVEVRAGVVIDATGDGHVAARAGVPCESREAPATFVFRLAGVDLERTREYLLADPSELWNGGPGEVARELGAFEENWRRGYFCLIDRAGSTLRRAVSAGIARGDFALERDGYRALDRLGLQGLPGTGTVQVNTGMIRIAGYDLRRISAAQTSGRGIAFWVTRFLSAHVPGFRNAWIAATPTHLGRRYSRVVETERRQDAAELALLDADAVGRYHTSPHRPEECRQARFIPWSCLVPRGIDGLVMGSGKSFNTGVERRQPHRAMGSTMLIGQIAGVAAALALTRGIDIRNLDPAEVRRGVASP